MNYEELNWVLDGFIKNSTTSVANAAYEVQQITLEYQEGKMSKQEYDELVGDLLNLERVTEQMNQQERRQDVARTLEQLKNAIGPIIGLIL